MKNSLRARLVRSLKNAISWSFIVALPMLVDGAFVKAQAATIAFVQVASAVPQSPQTSVPVTFKKAQVVGDLNVVVVGWSDATAQVASVTDTKGNVYTLAVGPTILAGSATQAIYYAKNIAAATANGNVVTVKFNVAAAFPDIRTAEYSGIDPVNPVDVFAAAQGSSTSSNSGAVTTTNANDLLVGANVVRTITTAAGTGFTNRVITSPDGDILEDRIVTATGSYSATATISSGAWVMQLVAFRAPGGAPAITTLNPSSGPAGSSVTITGANFGTTGTVTFNGVAATPTSWSATSIVVSVPATATTGNVVVKAGGIASNGVNFTVTPPPNISGLNPASAPAGASVTITGTNFGATTGTVTFNNVVATPTSWSATSIVVPVPAAATTGNVVVTTGGVASNGVNFTVTPPPAISGLNPTSGPIGTSVTISGSGFGAIQGTSTVKFNGTTATASTWSDATIIATVPTGAVTGNVVVTVSGVASGGMSFTVIPVPNISSLNPTSGPVSASVTITGTNFGSTAGTVTFNNVAATPTTWTATSIVVPVPATATTGNVVVTAGGVASNGVNFTVTPPPAISGLNPTSGSTGTSVTISGSGFGAIQGTNTVKFNSTTATASSWSDATIVTTVPAAATTGNVVVTISGVASGGVSFTVVPVPNISSLNPTSGPVSASVTITGTNFGSTTGTVTFNNVAATPTTWTATSIIVPVPATATTGNVVVTAGGVASNGVNFTVTPPPTISGLNPTAGPVGASVTITGTNFGSTTGTVTLNAVAATPTSWTATSIVVPVPATATTGSVVVTAGGVASNGVTFTVNPPPTITGLNPISGPVGSSVTISGANFGATQGTNTVKFNGTAATVSNWSDGTIVATVPSGATTGNVTVAVSGVSSNGASFTVIPTPNISSLNLTSGPVGASVTVTGTNFGATQGTGTVTFNNVVATPTSWTATSIVVPVPASATTGNVVVTANSVASNGVNFTVTPPPNISSANPTSGPVGTSVTITGTNFGTAGTVAFSGVVGTPSSWSATSIVVPVPTGATTGNVVVSIGGVASNAVFFTVTTSVASISFVQTNSAVPQSPQSSVSVTLNSAQTAGNLNVVFVGWGDTTAQVSSVTDTKGNTYVVAGTPTALAGSATQVIYYAKNIAAAAAGANAVKVTFSASAIFPDIRVAEYRGLDPVTPLDVVIGATGTSASSNSGSINTATANELLVAGNIVHSLTTAAGTGFTSRVITNPDGDILEDRIITATGSYSATATVSPLDWWVMQMAAFRAAGSVADTTPPTNPTTLAATALSGTQISMGWTASTDNNGVFQYLVERCQGSGCSSFTQVGTSTTAMYTDAGLTGNTSYSYRVRASDYSGNLSGYSNISTTTTLLSVSPQVADLTFTRTQQFTSSSGVTWLVDGVVGGSASTGTITTAGLYTPPAVVGTHTITAQGQSTSGIATVYVTNLTGVLMRDYDTYRTGLNPNETLLTPSNVNSTQFGKLFSYSIDGYADATTLYVANVNVPGQGFHNMAFVETEHDSVYGFDADGLSANPIWKVSFINPGAGITTITPADTGDSAPSDMPVESGITGTPVIDPVSGTLYVVAVTKEVVGSNTNFVQRLHALDIATGVEKFNGPVVIQASVPGTGDGASGGTVSFNALRENQRAALLLSNGVVYIGWAAHADKSPYHGWVMGYNASNVQQQMMVYNTTPNASDGGIWQSGDGLAMDASGRIFFVTGNGTFDANKSGVDYGDSFMAITTSGAVSDYFTPHDQSTMASNDLDLGSGGTLLVPDQPGTYPHLAISAGKNGTIYLVNRDGMGHYNASNDSQIVQTLVNTFPGDTFGTGNFKAPVYFNGAVYFSADADNIKQFQFTNGLLSVNPTSETLLVPSYPGATLGISANGTTSGIVWAVQRFGVDQSGGGTVAPGILHAYDATNLANELYNSNQAAGNRDNLDYAVKWSAPVVANGKVYVATQGRLTVFGLLP